MLCLSPKCKPGFIPSSVNSGRFLAGDGENERGVPTSLDPGVEYFLHSAPRGGGDGVLPIMAYVGRLRPKGVSQVEVYKRVAFNYNFSNRRPFALNA